MTADVSLRFSGCRTFGHKTVCRRVPARINAIPVDNERDSVILVILHHQERKVLWPLNKLPVNL